MEHEATLAFPLDDVRQVLLDPDRLYRCVPGLQLDLGEGEVAAGRDEVPGRLRLRAGGSTITYRGVLRMAPETDGCRIEAEGKEARGTGSVKAALVLRAEQAPKEAAETGGPATIVRVTASAEVGGRLAEAGPKAAASAGKRLLDRFVTGLGNQLAEWTQQREQERQAAEPQPQAETGQVPESAGVPGVEGEASREPVGEGVGEAGPKEQVEKAEPKGRDESGVPAAEGSAPAKPSDGEPEAAQKPEPAEAPHIPDVPSGPDDDLTSPASGRRTMIGRSAEEVDHAPPSGRYAPEPTPEPEDIRERFRWAAPIMAALVACAMVIKKVLRRHR